MIDHVLSYDGLAGICHVACDEAGQPTQIYYASTTTVAGAFPGQKCEAIVRGVAPGQGGLFLESETGEDLFLSNARSTKLLEGQRCQVLCIASARRGKIARVRLSRDDDAAFPSARDAWIAGVMGGDDVRLIDTSDAHIQIDEILEALCTLTTTLPSGGRLTISPTEALVAVDIDTAGRKARGNRVETAHSINLEAAAELARQIAVRDLGGAVVLDCLAPLSKARGQTLRSVFLNTFSSVSNRTVDALAPSKFGLMEIAIAWGRQPIHERLLDQNGQILPDTELWRGLRLLECEAAQRRTDRLVLEFPKDAFDLFQIKRADYMQRIQARFG
ncbi:MAG: ribonuclease E/G, partial [Pseudomonadota bacterium]